MARVLIISPDVLPLAGQPASGGSLRAWGLGEGLRSRGHLVEYATTQAMALQRGYEGDEIHVYESESLDKLIENVTPDILIFQHWPMLSHLKQRPGCYVVVDFHGPMLMEALFYLGPKRFEELIAPKVNLLSQADYFTCAGLKQMYYFLAWLSIAGFDLREFPVSVVPFSLSPDLPAQASSGCSRNGISFVYGGTLQPWQDPTLGLEVLANELSNHKTGELHIHGGANWVPQVNERFDKLRQQLEVCDRVHFYGVSPRSQLLEYYARADVAWDLMARNPERELAFTSRTVEYLWCGLPVVYNNYAELAEYIDQYDAGWIVDPADKAQIAAVVREIINNPAAVRRKGCNAQRLVRERLVWDATIGPLDEYCRQPYHAAKIAAKPYLNNSDLSRLLSARVKGLIPKRARHWLRRLQGVRKK